jgi:tetratricopeptide (TPR) repeat protein
VKLAPPALVAALAATAIAGPGSGSTRYPPEPYDADKEAEEHSDFWERALTPDRGRYDQLLVAAKRLMDGRTPKDLTDAGDQLALAIDLLPDAPDAYYLRGWAREQAQDWAGCADDYNAAAARDPDFEPAPNPRTRGGLADGQGVCLARSGKFDEAEEVLSAATATGTATAALWLRLGEVDMALGRLDDAITALDAALRVARSAELAPIHWLRAVAFDRARQPGDAEDAAQTALKADLNLSWVLNRQLPSAPPEDFFYIAGLAYETGVDTRPAQPERALLYYRTYVEKAAKSPWKKRAAEHVAALEPFDPASALTRAGAKQGTSTLDAAAIGKALKKDLAGLGKCMADVPQSVAEVKVVVHGAPARAKRGAPVVLAPKPPTAGVVVRMLAQVAGVAAPTTAETQAAVKCLETAAGKLRLAKLEKGTWVQLTFPVIGR